MTLRTLQKSVALLACLVLLSFAPAHARVESATVVVDIRKEEALVGVERE